MSRLEADILDNKYQKLMDWETLYLLHREPSFIRKIQKK